jgi:predicted glycosyltransferase
MQKLLANFRLSTWVSRKFNWRLTVNKNVIEEPVNAQAECLTIIQGQEQVPVPTSTQPAFRRKKVWIDIENSPHVPFFIPIIAELKRRGFELILTARDMYQVCELLDFFQLRSAVKVIGGHSGKNKALKVLVNCVRTVQLIRLAAQNRPDLALSHGSRAQVLACKALGIPTIMMHDYEHSTKTGFIEPNWILMPDIIPDSAMSRRPERTMKYPGLKEDVYIPRFQPDPSILNRLGIASNELLITLRPPATEAHYHNPESEELFAETLRLIARKPKVRAVTLPRNAKQRKQLQKEWADLIASGHMIIPDGPLDGLNLIWFSDLVVSGGGTMNREAAALKVPVYSIFRGRIGSVDRYLAEHGRMTLIENVDQVQKRIALVRRNRPESPEKSNDITLQTIVNNIVSILESVSHTVPGQKNTCG